uniref:SWIM-type domain-containing protein n=1 Tax=Nicotiana tabacum TaxID=4097 RepID=A0A1S4D0J2_TOBAC|nr:PREDICTED: uncharacterized protein LOC107824553 [Nicotiana tabacum]
MKADQRHATSKLISGYIIDNLRDPWFEGTTAFVMAEMQILHGLDIGYRKAWRAIQRASAFIRGTPEENYELQFLYMFYAYGSSIAGWNHYRPMIAVDATFLKSKYRGVLMISVSKDTNNQIFPLAFGIAESENNNSYEWYFSELSNAIASRDNLIVLSDRHQSIAHVIAKVLSRRRRVNWFLYMFYAYGLSIDGWNHCRSVIAIDATFLKSKYRGVLMISVSKDANNQIFPLAFGIAEFENNNSYEWYFSELHNVIASRDNLIIFSDMHQSIAHVIAKVFPVDSWRSRVEEEGNTFLVDLSKRTCDCFQFQFDELSCIHAIAAIEKRNIKKSNFCSNWYLKESWLKTYDRQIYPIGHTDSWIVPESVVTNY